MHRWNNSYKFLVEKPDDSLPGRPKHVKGFSNLYNRTEWGILHTEAIKNVHIILCPEMLPL
jgi:hypothetical protein